MLSYKMIILPKNHKNPTLKNPGFQDPTNLALKTREKYFKGRMLRLRPFIWAQAPHWHSPFHGVNWKWSSIWANQWGIVRESSRRALNFWSRNYIHFAQNQWSRRLEDLSNNFCRNHVQSCIVHGSGWLNQYWHCWNKFGIITMICATVILNQNKYVHIYIYLLFSYIQIYIIVTIYGSKSTPFMHYNVIHREVIVCVFPSRF